MNAAVARAWEAGSIGLQTPGCIGELQDVRDNPLGEGAVGLDAEGEVGVGAGHAGPVVSGEGAVHGGVLQREDPVWVKPSGTVAPAPITLSSPVANLRPGADVALALAISDDLTPDVRRHIASTGLDTPVISVRLPTGVSNASITGGEHAYAVALAIRDLAREIARTANPPTLHLFMAAPAGLAVLLGGVWDRVPTTQTYEDLGGNGYEPAFVIPN